MRKKIVVDASKLDTYVSGVERRWLEMAMRVLNLAGLAFGVFMFTAVPLEATTTGPKGAVTAGVQANEQLRYTEAEKQLVVALARAEAFGPQDIRLATILNELGIVYRAQYRYAEAELALKRAAHIWEQARGPVRVHAATALNNLAVLYHLQRRDNEAQRLFKRALQITKQTLGAEHPQFAASLTNLGVFHYDRGEYAKAEELYRRALETQERSLKWHHPDLIATLTDYAKVLRKLGRSKEATQLEMRAKAVGVEHAQ